MLKQQPDGTWVPVSAELEAKFVTLMRTQLGDIGTNAVLRAIENVDGALLGPLPEGIVVECLSLTGVDIAAVESKAAQDRDQQYERDFGPRTGPSGIAWDGSATRIHINPKGKGVTEA